MGCPACVINVTASNLILDWKRSIDAYTKLVVGGYVHDDFQLQVPAEQTDTTTPTVSASVRGGKQTGGPLATNHDHGVALFRVINGAGYKGIKITEASDAVTFQYVSQCSNRGTSTRPPAFASATRATPTTTATTRTCSPCKHKVASIV